MGSTAVLVHNAHLKGIIGKITNTPLFDKIKALEPQVSAKVYLIIKDLAQGSEDKINSIITELSTSSKKFDDIVQEARGLIGKYDWGLIKDYFQFIQQITGRGIGKKQIDKLKDALRAKEYTKLSASDYKKHTDQFTATKKNACIYEWEQKTGQTWPTYTQPYFSTSGTKLRDIGDKYDAHHIIEQKVGGEHEWWNMHPAKFPDEHQGGIHGTGSPSRQLFK